MFERQTASLLLRTCFLIKLIVNVGYIWTTLDSAAIALGFWGNSHSVHCSSTSSLSVHTHLYKPALHLIHFVSSLSCSFYFIHSVLFFFYHISFVQALVVQDFVYYIAHFLFLFCAPLFSLYSPLTPTGWGRWLPSLRLVLPEVCLMVKGGFSSPLSTSDCLKGIVVFLYIL